MENIDAYYNKGHDYMRVEDGAFSNFIFDSMAQVLGQGYKNYPAAVELGAGMGRFSFSLVAQYRRVYLIEPARAFAAALRELFPHEHVHIAETTAEEFFAGHPVPQDAIFFCFHLLHHLSEQQRRELFLLISSARASAVFVDPNPWNPLLLLQPFFDRDMRFKEEIQYLRLTRGRLGREIERCGLKVEKHAPLCLLPPFIVRKMLRSRCGAERLLRIERCRRIAPFMGSYHFFYCSSKR